jgi:hypothetical protein
MIQKVVKKVPMSPKCQIQEDLAYWLSRPPAERVAEVERLREMVCGRTQRLQRVARIVKRTQS